MIAAALLAAVPATVFAPPLDRPLTVRVEEERAIAGTVRRFVAERRLVFRRADRGYVADLTLVALRTDAEGPLAQRFLAGASGLKDRIVRYRLSATGEIVGIDDEDAVWAAAIRPLAALRSPRTRDPVPPPGTLFADLPRDRRFAVLARPLATLLAGREAIVAAGSARVSLAAGGDVLEGIRDARVDGSRVVLVTRAAAPQRGIAVDRTRSVARDTGLLIAEEEETRRTAGDAAEVTRHRTIVTG